MPPLFFALLALWAAPACASLVTTACGWQLRIYVPPAELPPLSATVREKIDWLRANHRDELASVIGHYRHPDIFHTLPPWADATALKLFDGALLKREVVEHLSSLEFHSANLMWLRANAPVAFREIQERVARQDIAQPENAPPDAIALGLYEEGQLHALTVMALRARVYAQP